MNIRRFPALLAALSSFFLSAPVAHAVCPVCTVAVAAGVGMSRVLGVDDLVTGIWIGGLTVSMIAWTIGWFDRKGIRFWAKRSITFLSYYALIVVPLVWSDIIGHPLNTLLGVDRLLFGIVVGSGAFLLGNWSYHIIKHRNGGHAWFKMQKVVWPIGSLVILSVVFFFVGILNPVPLS